MGNSRAPLRVAQDHEKRGDLGKAAKAYAQHLEADPHDGRVLLRLAEIRERMGDEVGAAELFARVGALHQRDGFVPKAIASYRRAAALDPHSFEHSFALANLLSKAERQKDADNVLTGVRTSLMHGEGSDRLDKLERLVAIDGHVATVLALSDALTHQGRADEAVSRLQERSEKLRGQGDTAERLEVLERLLVLRPSDRAAALEAARVSLHLGQPKVALGFTRTGLEHHRDDPDLLKIAASAIDGMGDRDRGTLLHREAARRLEEAGRLADARDEWKAVLAVDPEDPEARASLDPPSTRPEPAPAKQLTAERLLEAPEAVDEIELEDDDWAATHSDAPTSDLLKRTPMERSVEVRPRPAPPLPPPILPPLPPLRIELNRPAPPPPRPKAIPVLLPVSPHGYRPPPPPPQAPLPPPPPMVARPRPLMQLRRAMLVSEGPEAGWISRVLSDLDVTVTVSSPQQIEQAPQVAARVEPDLIVSPSEYASDWRRMGSWAVASVLAYPRGVARQKARAAQLAVVEAYPPDAAMPRGGVPCELVGNYGRPIQVHDAQARGLCLTLALQRFTGEILAQPLSDATAQVIVAGDGETFVVLGEWAETTVQGIVAFESPAGEGEAERAALAKAVARSLSLHGVAVLVMARRDGVWRFESMERTLGPGALAIEVRAGCSVVEALVELARGAPAPSPVEPRGHALAAQLPMRKLSSIANLRIEPSIDGDTAFVCAHAPDAAQAARRLGRLLETAV